MYIVKTEEGRWGERDRDSKRNTHIRAAATVTLDQCGGIETDVKR